MRVAIPKILKRMMWDEYIGKKYEGECYCCMNSIDVFNFHAGHVIPVSKGGLNSLENLRPLCSTCNLSMSDKNMQDFVESHNMPGKKNFVRFVKVGNFIYSSD